MIMMENDMHSGGLHQNPRQMFSRKQAEDACRFGFFEKVVATISDAMVPLAVEARDQEAAVHIEVRGGAGLPEIRLELDGRGVRDVNENDNVMTTSRSPDGLAHSAGHRSSGAPHQRQKGALRPIEAEFGHGTERCRASDTA
jgi:hypothetical protein